MAGVQMLRGRISTILAAFMLMAGVSLLAGSAAKAHAPAGSTPVDLIEGNTNTEDAGDAYITVDGDTVSIHWHLTGDWEGSNVINQFVCVGSYPISPAKDRCKPGQAPEGTVFFADPIGSDDWSFTYAGDKSAFQLHITVGGGTLLGVWEDPGESDDDGSADDGSVDDGSTDDGSTDDGQVDDGSVDDGSTDDGSTDDGSTDDGQVDDGQVDDGSTDDGQVDDGSVDDGSIDDGDTDGTQVEGNVVTKPKPKPKPEVQGEVLAQTGPETTMLTILGSLFVMLGLAMRFGRFGTPVAAATQAPDAMVARSLALIERAVGRNTNRNCGL